LLPILAKKKKREKKALFYRL